MAEDDPFFKLLQIDFSTVGLCRTVETVAGSYIAGRRRLVFQVALD